MRYVVVQSHFNYGDYELGEYEDRSEAEHVAFNAYEGDRSGIWDFFIYEREDD